MFWFDALYTVRLAVHTMSLLLSSQPVMKLFKDAFRTLVLHSCSNKCSLVCVYNYAFVILNWQDDNAARNSKMFFFLVIMQNACSYRRLDISQAFFRQAYNNVMWLWLSLSTFPQQTLSKEKLRMPVMMINNVALFVGLPFFLIADEVTATLYVWQGGKKKCCEESLRETDWSFM